VLLAINILLADVEEVVVVEPYIELLEYFVGYLLASKNCACSLANANGIAGAMAVTSEHLPALDDKLVVGNQTCTNVNGINSLEQLLGAWNRLEIYSIGNNGSNNSRVALVGHCFHQCFSKHNGYSETADTVGLNRKSPLVGHGLNNGFYLSTSLHQLVAGKVANVAGPNRKHIFSQQGKLLVHHFLNNRCRVNTG